MKELLKYVILLSVGLALFSSCSKDDEPLNSLAECTWITSEDQGVAPDGSTIIGKGDYISFMDVSEGYNDHFWEVPQNAGIYFLEGTMSWGENDYDSMINYDASYKTSDETIHLYFTEAGQHVVRLYNTYSQAVSYPYGVYNSVTSSYDLYSWDSKYINGEHVMDIDLTIDVYDTVLTPSAEVYKDEACTIPVTTGIVSEAYYDEEQNYVAAVYESITVEYGDTLYFKDTSTDRPNSWDWSCTAMDYSYSYTKSENGGRVVAIPFQALTYAPAVDINNSPLTISLTVKRSDTESLSGSKYIPEASSATAVIPLSVTVIPTADVAKYEVVQIDQENLQVQLTNSQFMEGLDVSVFDTSKFNISWTNNYLGYEDNGGGTIAVSSVSVNADNARYLDVALNEMIYNTDEIMFWYEDTLTNVLFDGGNLTMSKPTEANVTTTYGSFIECDFETVEASEGWSATLANGTALNVIPDFYFMNPLQDSDNDSDYVLYIDGSQNSSGVITLFSPTFSVDKSSTAGSVYYVIFNFMVPDGANIKSGLSPAFNTLSSGSTQGSDSEWITGNWAQINGKTADTWYTATVEVEVIDAIEAADMRLTMRFNEYNDKIYIDNFFFGNVEQR